MHQQIPFSRWIHFLKWTSSISLCLWRFVEKISTNNLSVRKYSHNPLLIYYYYSSQKMHHCNKLTHEIPMYSKDFIVDKLKYFSFFFLSIHGKVDSSSSSSLEGVRKAWTIIVCELFFFLHSLYLARSLAHSCFFCSLS